MRRICQLFLLGFCVLPAAHAQISFSTAIALALENSPQIRIGIADIQRAQAGLSESVDAYKPSFQLGSSVGYSYGFPVGQPSIYNLGANSLALSFSQPDYIRSARMALQAAQLRQQDTRQQVILDTAVDYIQLATVNQQVAALNQEELYAEKMVEIEQDRVAAGRDIQTELTQSRLTRAQIRLKRLTLMDQGDLLQARLAHRMGLLPGDIVAQPQTIPAPPDIERENAVDSAVVHTNTGVEAAYDSAKSKLFTALGDSKQNNHPTISVGGEYNRYAKFNNYNEYFLRFQHNNFNVGIQIVIPLFDAARTARAEGSSAEAARAGAQADQLRDLTREQALHAQKTVLELSAQEQVAELQSELARDQLDAVRAQLNSSGAPPNGMPVTPKDEEAALINDRRLYVDMLDTRFQLMQAQLTLLRSMNRIEDWVKLPAGSPAPGTIQQNAVSH